jgi:hypothetical protein
MSFKLSKQRIAERNTVIALLREKGEALEGAISDYNDLMARAWAALDRPLEEYNAVVEAVREESEGLGGTVQDWRDAWAEKSQSWQQGERGVATDAFIAAYEEAIALLEPVEVEEPEPVEVPDFSAPNLLEECLDEPDVEGEGDAS